MFRFLARSVLSTPRVDQMDRVHSLWETSAWIANTSFVLLVILGGLFIMGHQTLQTSFTAKDLGPRLVVAIVAANMNLPLIGQAIEFANALSQTFMGHGVDEAQAANTLKGLILHALTDATDPFTGLLALVAVIAGLVVLFTFAIRVMLLVLLTAAAPLALACHALPQAEGLAQMWWRAIAGVLAIQVAQALVLATALRVFFTSDQTDLFGARSGRGTFDLILVICLLYILARIPFWVSQMIFRGGMGRSPIVRAARTIAALLIFRNVGALKAGRAAGGPRRPPRLPPSPPALPPPAPPSNPPTWVQPQLPFPPSPPAGGTQLQLPITPPPQPVTPSPGWTQLRLPATSGRPSRWQQTSLPIRPRYTQTRLPAPPARGHAQPELPLRFPPPGSPQAGRSPRRLADTAALRDAEARARGGTTTPSSTTPWRNR
ncbi:conjugal transfer protein TrbL family protein [Actinoallomurus liliacearum]|uniref:conjugal transfer protein TrbL family protein n=1 Tax=Actinoallomurus liliacearum TaxID=1080073 RepID=UPI0031F145C1